MQSVEIKTDGGSFTLEVGENSRAFLWLFDMTQNKLIKSEMNTEVVTKYLVKNSGSSSQMARSFVSTVADIVQSREPVDGWGIWAGRYARKFAEEKCKREIKIYSMVLLGGLIGSIPTALFRQETEMGALMQIFFLFSCLLVVFGFYKIILLSMDLFQSRGGSWPEWNGNNNF